MINFGGQEVKGRGHLRPGSGSVLDPFEWSSFSSLLMSLKQNNFTYKARQQLFHLQFYRLRVREFEFTVTERTGRVPQNRSECKHS